MVADLTAEDVAKSLLAVPINLGQYNGTYGRLSTIIEDAVVVDDYTVEMHLTQPYYNALQGAVFGESIRNRIE